MPIVLAPIGVSLRIIKVFADAGVKKHLENLGIIADGTIQVISKCDGSIICLVKNVRLALDQNIATKIFVQEEK